ncbi:MAG: hypothetical protein JOY82_23570 [Streptosporangiaceae bacterium]|nr:hypothetical protein [Streptosporangiaceae bacterium]MBV9857463.1 hypothetical protein [Streptosporangiaceae bacterium]
MANTAPGAERLAGGVDDDAASAVAARPRFLGPIRRIPIRRLAGPVAFLLAAVVLFIMYLRLSGTYPENSDESNILLMASDMLHGNVLLHGWDTSDVPFITTELPQIALLVWMFGVHLNTAHIAAAVTYTLVVMLGAWLAKGRASGAEAVARMVLAVGIMLAPQPGVGVFVLIFSVGHIGTSAPIMATWLVLDRGGARRWVPPVVALLLAWVWVADPLVLVVGVIPLLVVCVVRIGSGMFAGRRGGLGRALRARWLEMSLIAAVGVAWAIAWYFGRVISGNGGYVQQPVPYVLDPARAWFWHARVTVHGLLEMFGAYFVPEPGKSGLDIAIALVHLVGVVLAVWAALAAARRFLSPRADFVSQLLLVAIVANLAAYIPSRLADATALNAREIAPVLPFAAVLAGRMLGPRLLSGPRLTVRLRQIRLRLTPSRAVPVSPARIPVRLLAVPLLLVLGFYSYGLWDHADIPAAPEPYAALAGYMESQHLTYGLGGYWEAGLITVETGGAVTIRAVTPACMQPYQWESKPEWYNPATYQANFVLIDTIPGYFSQFNPSVASLLTLQSWVGRPKYLSFGNRKIVNGVPRPDFTARVYQTNLLAQLPRLAAAVPGCVPASFGARSG